MFYENYLNSIKPDMSFIPESATIDEAGIFTERAIQDAYNETMITLVSKEIAVFESVMHEDENGEDNKSNSTEAKKGLLNTIGKFFSTIWEKVKGFFATIGKKIKEIFTSVMIKAKKIGKDEMLKAFDNLPDDFSIKKFLIPSVFVNFCTESVLYLSDYYTKSTDIWNNPNKTSEEKTQLSEELIKKSKEYFENIGISAEEMEAITDKGTLKGRKELLSKFVKDIANKSDVVKEKNNIVNIIFDAKTITDKMKNAYDATKKYLDNSMKINKDLINKSNPKDTNKDLKANIGAIKASIIVMKIATMGYINNINGLRKKCIGYVSKAIVASKTGKVSKDEESEATQESYEYDDFCATYLS